ESRASQARLYGRLNISLLCLGGVYSLALWILAPTAVGFVFGEYYGHLTPVVRTLCLVPLGSALAVAAAAVMKVRGEARYHSVGQLLSLVALLSVAVPLAIKWGALGAAYAN